MLSSESLEIEKTNNALSVSTKLNGQVRIFEGLKSVKYCYGEIAQMIVEEQGKYRKNELEAEYLKELQDFTLFWQKIMNEFYLAAQEEVVGIIKINNELKQEYFEIVEKVTGFRPPPDKIFLNLLAIRKIAIGLKNSDAVKFLNFDYFKKRNIHINEKWIKDRKEWLLKKIKRFEDALESHVKIIKNRLNNEMWKLHAKRRAHFDRLCTKFLRCKSLVSEINSKEGYQLAKMKKFFLIRHDVPSMSYEDFLPEKPKEVRSASAMVAKGAKNASFADEKAPSEKTIEKIIKTRKVQKV